MVSLPLLLTALLALSCVSSSGFRADDDVYEVTPPPKDSILNYLSLEMPFRMKKVNLLWEKARKRLSEGKLSTMYSDLQIQDKEEWTLKRLKAEAAGDKDGMREAEVRKAFNGIMNKYGLAGIVPEEVKKQQVKDERRPTSQALFKDKKLNRLWDKAEKAGLNEEELITLKQEFKHHQDKVEQYHRLLDMKKALEDEGGVMSNEIHLDGEDVEEELQRHHNALDGRAKEIKDDYDRLHRRATNTEAKEFDEAKVETLWHLAQSVDFTPDELESIRTELHHYQTRIQKLQFLEAELELVDERHEGKYSKEDKTEGRKLMDRKLKKHTDAIVKMRDHLEKKIASRHSEL